MPVHTRRSSAAPARHGASPGRARAGRAAASVDDLLEENLSLRYQVQKLQAVLSGNAGSPARNAAGHGADGEEQKFKHQIKKLQVFMNDHSSQSSALKTKLKGASDYVENLERERGRRRPVPQVVTEVWERMYQDRGAWRDGALCLARASKY